MKGVFKMKCTTKESKDLKNIQESVITGRYWEVSIVPDNAKSINDTEIYRIHMPDINVSDEIAKLYIEDFCWAGMGCSPLTFINGEEPVRKYRVYKITKEKFFDKKEQCFEATLKHQNGKKYIFVDKEGLIKA